MSEPIESTNVLYPNLPSLTDNADSVRAKTFRLQKIDDIQKELRIEINEREGVYTKYNKTINVCNAIETIAELGCMGAGAIGIASIATVISSPVGYILEGLALGLGGGAFALRYVKNKLYKKAKKHDEIRILAMSKLNTIENHVSKAIEDGCISQEEFVLVCEERNKYYKMKEKIRNRESASQTKTEVEPTADADAKHADVEKKILIEKLLSLK